MTPKTLNDVSTEIANATTNNTTPNLAGWDLTGLNLDDTNLQGANLREANLTDTNIEGANLTNANLRDSAYYPTQLLPTRGLDPDTGDHGIPPHIWDELLPTDPTTRELLEELLQDWDGTLQEAIATAELLHTA